MLAAEAGKRVHVSGVQMARHIVQVEVVHMHDMARSMQGRRRSGNKPTPESQHAGISHCLAALVVHAHHLLRRKASKDA